MKNQSIDSKMLNIFIAVGLAILIVCINNAVLSTLIPFWDVKIGAKNIPWQQIASGLTIAPLAEELIFRWIPLRLLKDTSLMKDGKEWFVISLISIMFGWAHGSYYNVFIQGVAGFFFGWVYIKNGFSYWSAVAAHFFYNFMVYIIFPLIII